MHSLRQAIFLSFLSFTTTFAISIVDNRNIGNAVIDRLLRWNTSPIGNRNANTSETISSASLVPTPTPSYNITTISSSPSVAPTLMPTNNSPSPTTTPVTTKPSPIPTLSPTTSPTQNNKKDHEWWNNVWKVIMKSIFWLFMAGLSVLAFGAIMSNRYRIYYYLRGIWYTFTHKLRRFSPLIRRTDTNADPSSTLNQIIFSDDDNDLQEGLLMRET